MTEVQKKITEKSIFKGFVSEQEFFNILKLIAPGTTFREALDGALQMKKGALIVVENENTQNLFEGGFRIGSRFTPQRLMELTKMDGAIILSKNLKKINYANVLLIPSSKFKSVETGTRHKAAERTAKEAETLVVAISERKNQITLYYKNLRYPLIDTGELLRRANEHVRLLEKQRNLFDNLVSKLNLLELKNSFDLKTAVNVIQKGKIIKKIIRDLEKYSAELGEEATLIKISLKEIGGGVEKETDLVIKDYSNSDWEESRKILNGLTYNEVLSEESISKAVGYEASNYSGGVVKGWRMLSKTSLSDEDIGKLISRGYTLKEVLDSPEEILDQILEKKSSKDLKLQFEKLRASF